VRVSDGTANTDAAITIDVTEVNAAPVLSGVPATATIPELAAYTFTASATDADVPPQTLTFSLVGAPAGATINASTGVFTWTPAAGQAGVYPFSVRVSDGVTNTDAAITITVNPTAIADLVATPVATGNDVNGTTKIQLSWSATPGGTTVEVFRAGFGGYPQYDGAGGTVPATPSYPPGPPWVATSVTAPGMTDEPGTRDYYYYVAFVHGSGSSVSAASNKTSGTLNYHLGDVSDGVTAGQGDNAVNTADISLLGAHYGLTGAAVAPYAYLDVGPTSDATPDGLPTTDQSIDFEDLMIFTLRYLLVSAPAAPLRADSAPLRPRAQSALILDAGGHIAVGDTLRCPITLRAAGDIQGVSVKLAWDPSKVRPVGFQPGALMEAAGVVLSPRPGVVDAAILATRGFRGEGVVATVDFVAIGAGDPAIRVVSVDARDAANRKLGLPADLHAPSMVAPNATSLALAAPNPFRESTTLAFDLAAPARVELVLYSVDGRRVRTVIDEIREPGHYAVPWDGRDDGGRGVAPGVYYVRFVAGSMRFTRAVVLVR
jgi:putative Ig domain-containing protein/flagellar hook capping protein FlgD